MNDTDQPETDGASVNFEGDANIAGDVVGRDKIVNYNSLEQSTFAKEVIGYLVASLLLFITNVLAVRFWPEASREWLDGLSIFVPLTLLLLFVFRSEIAKMRGKIGKVRRPSPSIVIVLVVTMVLIIGFGLLFRWISEGRVPNIDTISPTIYDAYRRIYNVIKP
jgi:hypothetical protein